MKQLVLLKYHDQLKIQHTQEAQSLQKVVILILILKILFETKANKKKCFNRYQIHTWTFSYRGCFCRRFGAYTKWIFLFLVRGSRWSEQFWFAFTQFLHNVTKFIITNVLSKSHCLLARGRSSLRITLTFRVCITEIRVSIRSYREWKIIS